MGPQGYDLQLTGYETAGWRATLYPAGREQSITQVVGSGWERTPGPAAQAAAWAALRRLRDE